MSIRPLRLGGAALLVSGLLAWPLVQNSLDLLRRRFGAH